MLGAATVQTDHQEETRGLELLELAGIPAVLLNEQAIAISSTRDFDDIATIVEGELHSQQCTPIKLRALVATCRQTGKATIARESMDDGAYKYSVELAPLGQNRSLLMLKRQLDSGSTDSAKQMREQIEQLQMAKDDLEQLAFVACHDLRSPLRALSTIPLWISTDVQETFGYLPETINEHTGWLIKQAQRLTTMLDDLLVYATIGSSREISMIKAIDWENVVQTEWEQLHTCNDFNLQLKLQHKDCMLPYNECTLAAKHLLRNAVKHHDNSTGQVEFETFTDEHLFHLVVRDDGKGIPQEHYETALKIFGTLQSRDDMEGTGIGLSLCKKIANSLHGSIAFSPGLNGRGTSVTLSIPYTMSENE